MALIELKSIIHFKDLISQNHFVICDFWAEWCEPCLEFLPLFEEFSRYYDGTICFLKVNIDDFEEITRSYKLFVFPSFLFFIGGRLWLKRDGGYTSLSFSKQINEFLEGQFY